MCDLMVILSFIFSFRNLFYYSACTAFVCYPPSTVFPHPLLPLFSCLLSLLPPSSSLLSFFPFTSACQAHDGNLPVFVRMLLFLGKRLARKGKCVKGGRPPKSSLRLLFCAWGFTDLLGERWCGSKAVLPKCFAAYHCWSSGSSYPPFLRQSSPFSPQRDHRTTTQKLHPQ